MSQHVYLIILWILFCIQHSLFASVWWKSRMSTLFGKSFRYYRFFYCVFAILNLAVIVYFQFTVKSPPLWKGGGLLRFIAFITASAGLIIMLACMRKYFFSISGVSAFSRRKGDASVLKTDGLHSWMRHPLYFGTLVFIWSFFLLYPLWSTLAACCIISVYTIAGIRIEERKLMIEFGDRYKAYAGKVPMLIPRF